MTNQQLNRVAPIAGAGQETKFSSVQFTECMSNGLCRLLEESKRLIRMVAVLVVVTSFGGSGPAGAGEPKAEGSNVRTVLFLGDSITAAGGYVRIIEAELAQQVPPNSWRVINRGTSSETLSNESEENHPGRRPCLFARLDKELADAKPDWVVACYGINDGIYHPFSKKRFEAYQAGIGTLIKKVKASGARLVLLTAPPYARPGPEFPQGTTATDAAKLLAKANAEAEAEAEKDHHKFGWTSPYPYYDQVLAEYAAWLLTLNGSNDVHVVDLRTPMLPKLKEAYDGDPIHPNTLGHELMAKAFLLRWPTINTSSRDEDAKPTPVPKTWSFGSPVPEEVVRSTRLLRERLLADPYRPGYHFCIPEDMMTSGDPNGAFYHNGRYHLMYLYYRSGSGFCWGHISSLDLVHWRHHPDAIAPGQGDEGCWSGGTFVDDDGTAYLTYWMLWCGTYGGDFRSTANARGIGLAKSRGPNFDAWQKFEANPVIKSTEFGVTEANDAGGKTIFYGSADPSNIWKKEGRYYMVTGNLPVLNKVGRDAKAPLSEQGDRVYLFVSDDLKQWKYLHVFYDRIPEWTDRGEDNMCPSFLPLPSSPDGGPPSGKHLLLFISHVRGCQYYVGDYRDDRFYPDNHGRMSWIDGAYCSPEALIDGKGRQISWAWLTDNLPDEKTNGWSGVYALPRTLWLGEDGTLRLRPVKELEILRCNAKSWSDLTLSDGRSKELEGVTGDSCELELEIAVGAAKQCGLKVLTTPDGEGETLLYYDAQTKELVFDTTRSGSVGRKVVERAPFALKPGEKLNLRVFVDKAVVEVFANDRQAISRRVYPSRRDSLGVSLFAIGGSAQFRETKAWEIMPSNPY